ASSLCPYTTLFRSLVEITVRIVVRIQVEGCVQQRNQYQGQQREFGQCSTAESAELVDRDAWPAHEVPPWSVVSSCSCCCPVLSLSGSQLGCVGCSSDPNRAGGHGRWCGAVVAVSTTTA